MIKKGVVKSLYDRAKIICNDQNFIKEKDMIKNVLIKNNYPSNFIDKCFQHFEQPNLRQNNDRPITNLFIPYIPGMSDKLKRIGKRFNIRTIYKTENTLRSLLTKTKPNNINENTKNVIYKIPCECNKFYIGETCRPLSKRIKEHKSYIKNTDYHKSNICQHAFDNNHRINWNASSVLAKETLTKKRKIKESALILLNEDNCVASCSVNLSNTWLPLLKHEAQTGNLKIN
jgi:predicted GIY-YIG superfamily endonuclease